MYWDISLLFHVILLLNHAEQKDWFNIGKKSDTPSTSKPNIIIITASGLGWDDISFHGNPLALTYNMETMARHGVILNSHYINSWEFSTKVELLTGKYAARMGLQHGPVRNSQPISLPTDVATLPKLLQQQGYKTHYVGRWGLGFYKKSSLPTYQGFDTFYGSVGFQPTDYYNFTSQDQNFTGYDLYNNTEVYYNTKGVNSQNLFTDVATEIIYEAAKTPEQPIFLMFSLQLPQSYDPHFEDSVPASFLESTEKLYSENISKIHGAKVMMLDVALGRIMDSLASTSMLDNSLILLFPESTSEACPMSSESTCNYPLRGGRGTVWEGGIRTSAIFYSSKIKTQGNVIDYMIHVTDWLPTLLAFTGAEDLTPSNINGVNIMETLISNNSTNRTFIFHNFDSVNGEVAALRVHEYKLIVGQKLDANGAWSKEPIVTKNQTEAVLNPGFRPSVNIKRNHSSIILCDNGYPHPLLKMHAPPCIPSSEPCLFNLNWDPCEFHNLASFMGRTAEFLLSKLNEIKRINALKRPVYPSSSIQADPKLYDGVWKWWEDDDTSILNSTIINQTIASTNKTYPIYIYSQNSSLQMNDNETKIDSNQTESEANQTQQEIPQNDTKFNQTQTEAHQTRLEANQAQLETTQSEPKINKTQQEPEPTQIENNTIQSDINQTQKEANETGMTSIYVTSEANLTGIEGIIVIPEQLKTESENSSILSESGVKKFNHTIPENIVLVGSIESPGSVQGYNTMQDGEILSNNTNEDIEKLWDFQHNTVNLTHFRQSKNKEKLHKSKNETLKLENLSHFDYNFNLTDTFLTNNTKLPNSYEPNDSGNSPPSDSNLNNPNTGKTEVLEIYETPMDMNISFPTQNLNEENSDINRNGPNIGIDVIGTKRENLPNNVLDYKIALSKAKTKINSIDTETTNAFIKTKAIAGGSYDEKSNRYDGKTGQTSIEDQNFKTFPGEETPTRVYSLKNVFNTKNNSIDDTNNSSVEDLFIDWNILSKQNSIITQSPDSKIPFTEIPKNLVTSEPVEPKSSIFVPYNYNENQEKIQENPILFQRATLERPYLTSQVVAVSDADNQTSNNKQKLTYSSVDDKDNILNVFSHVSPPVYDQFTKSPELEHTKSEMFSEKAFIDNDRPLEIIHDKMEIQNKKESFSDENIKLEKGENLDGIAFHGRLNFGSHHTYEVEGRAKDLGEREESITSPMHNKYDFNSPEDPNHVYGISISQPNTVSTFSNKMELTESTAKIMTINGSEHVGRDKNLFENSFKIENTTTKSNVAKSYIPDSGAIGDENDNFVNSEDFLKMLNTKDMNTMTTNSKIIKEASSQPVSLNNIENPFDSIYGNISDIKDKKEINSTTVMPFSIFSISNETRGDKKGYPFSRPIISANSGATVISTVVAVVLSAFVIVGMAVIAIVAILAKNYGNHILQPIKTQPGVQILTPPSSTPPRSQSIPHNSPKRNKQINR